MRIPLLAAVVAGATLTQVGASPLRVVVVSSNHQELPAVQNLRFGYPLADSHVAKISNHNQPPPFINLTQAGRRPCSKRIKDKAIQISNAFRHALGLPPIETAHAHPGDNVHGGMIQILPFIGTPPAFVEARPFTAPPPHAKGFQLKIPELRPQNRLEHKHHRPCHRIHQFHQWGNTFMMRVHSALMALGPWEGRAVAFVLGCGIGVLLRMFWVLTVVTYRAIRGDREDDYTQVAVIEEYVDAEDVVVPPPTYTASDEKGQLKEKDAPEN
ncbi:hypothetical protein D9756_010438 [Leucocoprinus leucothites]|uniref:Uncharacterized protein n=1 Tax=Leucocoprinus leucothites TaxID=201217 RepID=A0A8H5CSU8_9AGAR|nr:hypothetical protein D9756_010438 [Leucoagaricus leucothites]